ncbi:hypothetical protein OG375_06575 [Micromonospora zamorensis]|uniref:Uncharacterized protein n=1 Tax=Micromonospora zamorensis TaxID=709883 RepID=A0ABZ1PLJ3_9ACTN
MGLVDADRSVLAGLHRLVEGVVVATRDLLVGFAGYLVHRLGEQCAVVFLGRRLSYRGLVSQSVRGDQDTFVPLAPQRDDSRPEIYEAVV